LSDGTGSRVGACSSCTENLSPCLAVSVNKRFTLSIARWGKVMFEELYVAGCLTMLAAGLITILSGTWRG
jgi:hypothetical protein